MNIDDRICIARAKHEFNSELADKRLELIRLQANRDKVQDLVRVQSHKELVAVKLEHELMVLNYRLRLAEEELKQAEARYQLEIEFPAKLEAFNIARSSSIEIEKNKIESEAKLSAIRDLARAHLMLEKAEVLAESKGLKWMAEAWSQCLRALVRDKLCGRLLNIIAKTIQVDPDFRLKLHRPLRMRYPGKDSHTLPE